MLELYPDKITPYTIEIELTNHCNASCEFCCHSTSSREKGFMDIKKLKKFLIDEKNKMNDNWFNKKIGKNLFPKIVLAGLGEALMHPQIFEIIKIMKELEFRVQLVTNGLLLTDKNIQGLIETNVDEVCISLHSINKNIYKSITGLDLKHVLPKVEKALEKFEKHNVHVEIWRVKPSIKNTRESKKDQNNFENWINKYKNIIILGPSEPWNRDNTIESLCEKIIDNPDSTIWCHKIYFTYNIAWNGDVILCCNDYNRKSVNLGNAFSKNFDVEKEKIDILFNGKIPQICKNCKRWKDTEYANIIKEYNIQ